MIIIKDLLRDARKIFRIFKGINELQYIGDKITNDMCFSASSKDIVDVIGKLFYFFYWFFDNLSILSKTKLISNLDTNKLTKLAMLSWFLGNVASIIKLIMDLDNLFKQKLKLDPQSKEGHLKIDKSIFNTYLNIKKQEKIFF